MQPQWEAVRQRLLGQFAAQYITLTSIIQSVALGYLVTVFERDGIAKRTEAWVLGVTMFAMIVDVWNEFRVGASTFLWYARIWDALVLFLFGAIQLAMIGSLKDLEQLRWIWFCGYAGVFLVALCAYWNVGTMTRAHIDLNPTELRDQYLRSAWWLCGVGLVGASIVAGAVLVWKVSPVAGGLFDLALLIIFMLTRERTWTKMVRTIVIESGQEGKGTQGG